MTYASGLRVGEVAEWLFPGSDRDQHISELSVQKIFEKARSLSHIHKEISVHTLRHSFATHIFGSWD